MWSTNMIIDDDVLEAVKRDLPHLPDYAAEYYATTVKPELEQFIETEIAVDPGPVVIPFEFASPKSQAAYFATNGFGKGIPSQRTGNLNDSWMLDIDRRQYDGFIALRNRAPYAGYVLPPFNPLSRFRQVPGHAHTGWGRDLDDKFIRFSELGVSLIIDGWYEVVQRIGQ